MHELSIATQVMEQALEVLERMNAERAIMVRMRIGALSFVAEEQLRFAYEAITEGTALEGSKLVIAREEARVLCQACGYKGGIEMEPWGFPILSCPRCGRAVEVLSGKGYTLENIVVEVGDEHDG
ncbi:MAG: hydrogenase maturation nickel metallochaperone HypA [Candidatus Thermoplasmatota archaeon]